MIVRHRVRQIRRQHHRLPPVASDEVLGHDRMVLNTPDVTPLSDSHRGEHVASEDGARHLPSHSCGYSPLTASGVAAWVRQRQRVTEDMRAFRARSRGLIVDVAVMVLGAAVCSGPTADA